MDPALAPWVLVSELHWMSSKLLERRLRDLGVSVTQSRVLSILHYAAIPIAPSAIEALLFQESESAQGVIRRAASRGWVERLAFRSRHRRCALQLTEAGNKLAERAIQISRELYDELFAAALSETERHDVESALRKVRAVAFALPETDVKLRRAQQFSIWTD